MFSGVLAVGSLALTIWSISSYGSKGAVWYSWTGITLGNSVFKSNTDNAGSLTPVPTTSSTWVSDKKYIMWKDGGENQAVIGDYSKWSQGNQNGYDSNY